MNCFEFVADPNLPAKRVNRVVISPEYPQVAAALNGMGIEALTVTLCSDLQPAVQGHADMLFAYLGCGNFAAEKSQKKLVNQLNELGLCEKGTVVLKEKYPHDIALNSCILGRRVLCNSLFTCPEIVHGREVIDVRQGYAKCSCVVVDENSIITDDPSVNAAALKSGIDVLLVGKGDVVLDGMNYGFIGGCCGKIAPDTLAFCGDASTHGDYQQIVSFLKQRSVNICSLFGGKLLDIGSIIPITQII